MFMTFLENKKPQTEDYGSMSMVPIHIHMGVGLSKPRLGQTTA